MSRFAKTLEEDFKLARERADPRLYYTCPECGESVFGRDCFRHIMTHAKVSKGYTPVERPLVSWEFMERI